MELANHFAAIKNDPVDDLAEQQIFKDLNTVLDYCNKVSDPADDPAGNQESNQVNQLVNETLGSRVKEILTYVQEQPRSKKEILSMIGLKNHTDNRKKYIDPLFDYKLIAFTIPEKPTHQDQKYQLTSSGLRLLNLIKR